MNSEYLVSTTIQIPNNVSNRNFEANRISVRETYWKTAFWNTKEVGCEHKRWLRIVFNGGLRY
jgi:hypothetical protein